MYLLHSAPRTVNKFRLGRLGDPGTSSTDQSWRRLRGLRGLGRLGVNPVRLPNLGRLGDASSGYCTYFAADGVTPENFDFSSSIGECQQNGGAWTAALNTPMPSGRQNPSPITGSASNGGITTVTAAKPSGSPLDYTSPQAAIAAGLDPQTVYNAWTAALARFPSPQAAIAAGVPAGVVNQLWQQANVNKQTAPPSFLQQNFGLIAAGGVVLLLAGLRKRGR